MSEAKKNALAKMLEEMNEAHSGAEDYIHNWLCEQEDDVLFNGILKDDRSISGALDYCTSHAEQIVRGNCAAVDDPTVFGWVREYFVSENIKISPVKSRVVSTVAKKQPEPPKPKTKVFASKPTNRVKKEASDDMQLSLFDSL